MDNLYIGNSSIHGKGVFTKDRIEENCFIFEVADLEKYKSGKAWISRRGRYVNHQKEGNCKLVKEGDIFSMYSNRVILQNEELTSDYTVLPFPFSNNVNGYKENK